ncbi:unnamed protein product [Somion occarium]|uniref:WW domain-containing protein n=1 Tax=Somion occarium TaxID=3059160 RepID=A0ABP1CV55_9APHY
MIPVLLRYLGNLLRRLCSGKTPQAIWARVLRLWVHLKRFALLPFRRICSPGTLHGTDSRDLEKPKSYLENDNAHSDSEVITICTSQVPPSVMLEGSSPIQLMTRVHSRPVSMVHSQRPTSEQFLHPYSYAPPVARQSAPDMGLHRLYSPAYSVPSRPCSPVSSKSGDSTRIGPGSRGPSRANSPRPLGSRLNLGITAAGSQVSLSLYNRETAPPSIHTEAATLSDVHAIYPTLMIERYDRNIKIPLKDENDCIILPPKTLEFKLQNIPEGWTPCQHPEELTSFEVQLKAYADDQNIEIPDDAELVLELQENGEGSNYWMYYYVHHPTRSLFWLHEHDITWATSELLGKPDYSHLQHEITRYYWIHWENFPHGHILPPDVIEELMGILLHAVTDQLTSPTSTILYSVDDLERMLNIARNARNLPHSPYTTCTITRLLHLFIHAWFLNYHGQHGARLNRDQSVHGVSKHPRTYLIRILAPLLFNAPMVHLRALEKIWVDQCMCHQPWAVFIEKLKSEWEEFILYGTVLLNANVAFLAIPSVDEGNGIRTPSQIASYISIVASIGSIIIGLLLVRQYRVRPRDTVEEAAVFLARRSHPTRGVETLAILYSLPYALLLWAMVTFLLAFSLECFTTDDRVAIWIAAAAWTVTGFLIVWCIYSAWEDSQGPAWKRVLRALRRGLTQVREQNRVMLAKLLRTPAVNQVVDCC